MHIMLVEMSYEKSIPTVFNHIIRLAPISDEKDMKTHNYYRILVLSICIQSFIINSVSNLHGVVATFFDDHSCVHGIANL